MEALIDPGEYAALAYCSYLNQASLGLIPRTSVEASVRFLTEVAQHGNLRLSDQAEATVLDGLRTAAAGLLGAPVASVAVVGGASEGLGQLAALLSNAGDEVVLVPSDFPSVTYPWLAAHDRWACASAGFATPRTMTSRSRWAMPSANAPRWCASARFNSPLAARSMSRPWRRAPETPAPGWWLM